MEKKRKLPARAAARAEQAAKKRTATPPRRSSTPAPTVEPEPTPVNDAPPSLPKSVTAGKPLPTVDSPQPDDLPTSEYQTVTESGVLAESLSRSRQKWTMEGIFEKYWSKPTKKKGVVIEEPNNPPKDSMMKLGQVTITVEPHVFEATMYAVKDPKPAPPPPPPTQRPIVQYGPPNGIMPPPPTPTPTPASSTPASASAPAAPAQNSSQTQNQEPAPAESKPPAQAQPNTSTQTPTPPTAQPNAGQSAPDTVRPAPSLPPAATRPVASPRGMETVLSPSTATPLVPQSSSTAQPQNPRPTPPPNYSHPTGQAPGPAPGPIPGPPRPAPTTASNPPPSNAPAAAGQASAPGPAAAPAKPPPGTDPIILMLAEKAGTDPQLRDLMKRVAQGEAAKHELERFQAIIDAITAESKRNGSTTGPSADRLLVDGRTVRYFADEVRAILDIVLSSNPKQTSADLRPPPGSDPLVVQLVKNALDDSRTRDIVRRIAENKAQFADATDLKIILDSLRTKLIKERERQQTQSPVPASPASAKPNGASNGPTAPSSAPPQTALRSKGPPPPPPKPDISAIVLEFAGGTGDRYLFPKFSLLEYVPVPSGQQVIASFLLVRKGSQAEYPMADPKLDYYQPLTIRLFASTGRHLEHLARVVAPPEEVKRYMNDVMTKMTRAEYILLAMRLPRRDGSEDDDEREGKQPNGGTAKDKDQENGLEKAQKPTQPPSVLWTTKASKAENKDTTARAKGSGKPMDADEQYQSFIASVSRKEA
ncbi:hypothetical protein VTH82DRAFT_6310 [Thermothelomyces myriococcoides]